MNKNNYPFIKKKRAELQMEITVKFDVPEFPTHFLDKCGLIEPNFEDRYSDSCKAFKILSLFLGEKKHAVNRPANYHDFTPYHLVDEIKRYMPRFHCTAEWQLQLLVAMILHTCSKVSLLRVEGVTRRVPSRTGAGSEKGRYDILYESNDCVYVIELKFLSEGDVIENELAPLEWWKLKDESTHLDSLFGYARDSVKTIGDALQWSTVQAASYRFSPKKQKRVQYAGIVLVVGHSVLLHERIVPVYDFEEDDDPTKCIKSDFAPT